MNLDDALAIFKADVARYRRDGVLPGDSEIDPRLPTPVDWYALFRRESDAEWLVENIWPVGRQVHLHAARKTGKSLVSLWIACSLATGTDPFTGNQQAPVKIGYLDFEMTEDDLLERVEEMGFTADQLTGHLCYFLHPAIPMLDTPDGGVLLLETLQAHEIRAVVVDTMSRVVAGDENSNDTYIRFFKNTGQKLKAAGIALFRLDHEGHEKGRSRGASAKADDVDIVWQLVETEDGLSFVRKAARMSWVPEKMSVRKDDEQSLRFTMAAQAWPIGTMEKVKQLDECGVADGASRREAMKALKDAGLVVGKTSVVAAAIRYRQRRIFGL